MRFAFFDGLLESHVPESLQRALEARGHSVYNTGKIGHGFIFESKPGHISSIEHHIDDVISFQPDFVLVFRPASLPPTQLKRLSRSGATMAVWLSDDPVLWNLSYRPVLDRYDIVLNCGSQRVLEFYDRHFGRPVGVNMPFWTDETSFPYVYGRHEVESTAMFLGNVQDEVRRRRYFALSDLETDVRIHGNTGIDFNNLSAGYLDSDDEVSSAASRALVAINIPQYFRDHEGLPTWFEGLDELGTFQFPSRVIQYAAMGLPIVSVTPQPSDYDTFPEMRLVESYGLIDGAVSALVSDPDMLQEVSRATHTRFRRHFSAESRALALENIASDVSWRTLNIHDRARWFAQFDGNATSPTRTNESLPLSRIVVDSGEVDEAGSSDRYGDGGTTDSSAGNTDRDSLVTFGSRGLRVAVIGEGWTRASSQVSTLYRALVGLGHTPVKVTPMSHSAVFGRDPSNEFRAFVNATKLLQSVSPDVVLFVGSNYVIPRGGCDQLREQSVPFIVYGVSNRTLNIVNTKLATRADYLTVSHPDLYRVLRAAGFSNVQLSTPIVDRQFVELSRSQLKSPEGMRAIAARRADLSGEKFLMQDLIDHNAALDFVDERSGPPSNLEQLLEYVRAAVVVVPPDGSLPGVQPSDYFAFALAGGGLVVTPRLPGSVVGGVPGRTHITARDRYELTRKTHRLAEDYAEYARYLSAAREFVDDVYGAEDVLRGVLQAGSDNLKSHKLDIGNLVLSSPFPAAGVLASSAWKPQVGGLLSARLVIKLDFNPPFVHEMLKRVTVRIVLDEQNIAYANLADLVGECELYIDVPSRTPRAKLVVQLHSDSPLPFFNWKRFVSLKLNFSQRALSSPITSVGIASSSSAFNSTLSKEFYV